QDFYEPKHCNNFMMHLLVEDVASWHEHVSNVDLASFGAKMTELVDQPWKMREFCLHDPSGVLWRIGQNI
ncbi:glyoxalase, partial [Vibrio rotiferianus]